MNEPVATTTASFIANGLTQLLIFISEVLLQWVPAAIYTFLGSPVGSGPFIPGAPTSPTTTPPVTPSAPPSGGGSVAETAASVWDTLVPILIFISLLLAAAIIYATIRFVQVNKAKAKALEAASAIPSADAAPTLTFEQKRWQRVLEQAGSENENDWRLAILEADIMLDEALEARGHIGEGVGERLRRIDPGDLQTLDMAWEAHKVRNDLAHRGSKIELNNRETQRVITLFENVLRELRVI